MKKCTLCPRNCAVDRGNGERGVCGQTEGLKVARAALHAAKRKGLAIPIVYNTSSYESVDTIRQLEGLVDV